MNPELDQDDINIEEFLYPCLTDKNEKLRLNLNSLTTFNKTLVNIFEYYTYYEKTISDGVFDTLPDQNPNNNTAFYAMQSLYAIIPVFSDAKSCAELENIINQNLGQLTTYFNSLPGVTNIGVLGAQPFLETLQVSFIDLLIVLPNICEIYKLG